MTADEVKLLKGRGWLPNKEAGRFSARIVTVNGMVTSDQLAAVAEAANRYGRGDVTFTSRQSIEVPGVPAANIAEFESALAAKGLAVGGTGPRVRPVVSCKGTVCPCGLIDTFALAAEIHRRFYEGWHGVALPGKFKIAVGGCPNNCVKPSLNDIGVTGALLPGGGRGYRVALGGHWGRTGAAGRDIGRPLESEDEVLGFIGKALTFYRMNGQPGERFFKTLDRIGFDAAIDMICSAE